MIHIEEKIIGLSAKEMIMAMVNGLRKRHVCIDMSTFGRKSNGVCFGCAATNALIEISGISAEEAVDLSVFSCKSVIISDFETAIDSLRCGDIYFCNIYLEFPEIVNPENIYLPILMDDYTEDELQQYEKLANSQYC
jgi:hypothetical protein